MRVAVKRVRRIVANLGHRLRQRAMDLALDELNRRGLHERGLAYRMLITCMGGLYLYASGKVTLLRSGSFFGVTPAGAPDEFFLAVCRSSSAPDGD